MHCFSLVATILVVLIGIVLPIIFSYVFSGRIAQYISPPYGFHDIPNLTGKVAIVTGSNTGIGYVTARELARKGAKVIVAARNAEKGHKAVSKIQSEIGDVPGAGLIEFMKLDLSSLAEVKSFATDFEQMGVGLDILVLNAGVMAPDFGKTVDGFETQIGTNHFGHFLLVNLLIPIIKSSKARVVHVSSVAHRFTYAEGIRFESFSSDYQYEPLLAYGQSKLANILFSNELAKQLNGTGATSNSLHPGLIKTELSRHMDANADKTPFLKKLLSPLGVIVEIASLNADGGALTQLYAATAPEMEAVNGAYYIPIAINGGISDHAQNLTLQTKLWDESVRLTQAYF